MEGTTDAATKQRLQAAFAAIECEKADAPLAWVLAVSPVLLLASRKIDGQALSNVTLFEVRRISLPAGCGLTVVVAFAVAISEGRASAAAELRGRHHEACPRSGTLGNHSGQRLEVFDGILA